MIRDNDAVDLCSLWQSQPTTSFRMSPGQMRARMERLDAKLRRGSYLLYGVCVLEIVAFTLFFFAFPDPIQRIGSVLTVVGMGYLIYQIRLHRINTAVATTAVSATPSVEHYRVALERQRDFHRGIWFWSRFVIFMPGPLVFLLGAMQAEPDVTNLVAAIGGAMVFLAAVAIWLNLRLARRYQARIDDTIHLQQEHR